MDFLSSQWVLIYYHLKEWACLAKELYKLDIRTQHITLAMILIIKDLCIDNSNIGEYKWDMFSYGIGFSTRVDVDI